MSEGEPTVFVVDDDPSVRRSTERLVRSIEVSANGDTGAFLVAGIDGTAINGAPSAAVTGVRAIRMGQP
jgi:hypothetical protein